MRRELNRIAIGACILALAACSSGGDDSAKISSLEADLADANTALSDHQAATAAAMHYHGLDGSRRISGRFSEEVRADDGSTLTIEFSGEEQDRADIVLDRTDDTPPPIGDALGEEFDGTNMPRPGVTAHNVAVLYRIPLGADSVLQYGWWAAEGSNSAGRTWIERYGPFVSARGDFAGVRDIAGMTGQAVFEGHAAGVYAISNPAAGHNESGAFTADAMLTVDFDNASASGTIGSFVAAGEEKEWTVSLLSQGFSTGAPSAFTSPPRNGRAEVQWTISAEQDTPGESGANWWFASLVQDGTDNAIMGAVGEFSAQYTNIGRMHGTFGAKRQ